MRPTSRFRELLARDGITMLPAVGDPFFARVVAREGFEALAASGNGTSAMRLGLPDVGLLSLMENVENAGRIAEASGLPVMADADTGYGNALSMRRTIREFEAAGVAAIMFEDQQSPKRCGMLAGKRVIGASEMVGKIKAAVDARRDPDLVIVARTDARAPEGFEPALERAVAYREAGADAIFFEGPRSLDEVRTVSRTVAAPLLYNVTPSGPTPKLTRSELSELGFKLMSFSIYVLLAALPGAQRFLRTLRETGDVLGAAEGVASFDEYKDILGYAEWQDIEARYVVDG